MAFRLLRRSTRNTAPIDIFKRSENGIDFFLKTPINHFHLNSRRSPGACITHDHSWLRRQISWMGTLSARARSITTNSKVGLWFFTSIDKNSEFLIGKAINISTSVNAKNESRRLNIVNMHSQFPFSHRMLSTSSSSHHSRSKFQDEKKEDSNISTNTSIVRENSSDKYSSVQQVMGDDRKKSFQSMLRQYGKVFIGTYMAVYVSTVLGIFASIQSGQLDAMYIISLVTSSSAQSELGGVAAEATSAMNDLLKLLDSYAMTRPVAPLVEKYPWTANFAIAWIATKFTEPIRFGVTVVVTPPLSKFLGHRSTPAAVKNGPIQVVVPKRGDTSSHNSTNTVKENKEL